MSGHSKTPEAAMSAYESAGEHDNERESARSEWLDAMDALVEHERARAWEVGVLHLGGLLGAKVGPDLLAENPYRVISPDPDYREEWKP